MTTKKRGWLLLCGAILSCRTSSDTGSDSNATVNKAVQGSTTLQQALTGKFEALDPPGGKIAADITGEASVGHDGSANYRVPIWVPEGVNGLKPSLAIEYNSESTV